MEVIGLQKEKDFYRLACLTMTKGKITIEYLKTLEFPLTLVKGPMIASGVEGQELLIRELKTPLKKKKALNKTLPFQLEGILPYSLNDVVVKPQYFFRKEETKALFFTVPKRALSHHIESLQAEGVDPDWVSSYPHALYRYGEFLSPSLATYLIFYLGVHSTELVAVDNKRIICHLTLRAGLTDLEADEGKLQRDIDRALFFLDKKGQGGHHQVIFCGQEAERLERLLLSQEKFPMSPVQGDEARGFDEEMIRPFAIPIGLALEALKDDASSLQLRQGEYSSKQSIKVLKKGLLRGGLIALLLFSSALVTGKLLLQKQENKIFNRLEELINHHREELPELRKIKAKGSVQSMLSELTQQVKETKTQEGYFSPPPRLADLLVYLSTHPAIKTIEIIELDYQLIRYPDLDHPQAPYVPKVTLTFTTTDSVEARGFHDAIVEDEGVVNLEKEIGWKRNENTYEISFFLQA